MTRRTLLAIPLAVGRLPDFDDLRAKVIEFERAWDIFVRKLFGCRLEGELSAETCDVAEGTVDYAAFSRARRAARKLFELKDAA